MLKINWDVYFKIREEKSLGIGFIVCDSGFIYRGYGMSRRVKIVYKDLFLVLVNYSSFFYCCVGRVIKYLFVLIMNLDS